jgi:diaminopimelate epimerase
MTIEFYKYHGAGNDFILINNCNNVLQLTTQQIAHLCHRNYGIGADGLMLLENDATNDFKMVYYNSDGKQSTMCGNGGRCIALFAQHLSIISNNTRFMAIDGLHTANINVDGTVSLQMIDVPNVIKGNNYYEINTGSPHYVAFINNVDVINVATQGALIRNQSKYMPQGINVNFVEAINHNQLKIRTYERGVENETLACGTGVTAAAIAYYEHNNITTPNFTINIQALGGDLSVAFNHTNNNGFSNIVLTGPARFVYKGSIEL